MTFLLSHTCPHCGFEAGTSGPSEVLRTDDGLLVTHPLAIACAGSPATWGWEVTGYCRACRGTRRGLQMSGRPPGRPGPWVAEPAAAEPFACPTCGTSLLFRPAELGAEPCPRCGHPGLASALAGIS